MKPNPNVGIIITTCDRQESLRNALNVIASQTYSNHVVVVVDDASKNATANRRIAEQYQGHLEYVENPNRMGIARTRELGIQTLMMNHQPDLVCMLDDDDHWFPDRLYHGVCVTKERVGMSYGIQWMTDVDLQPLFKYPSKTNFTRALLHALLFGEFTFPAKTYMFNAEFLQEMRFANGDWYAKIDSREDVELAIRAMRHAKRNPQWQIVFCPKLLANWVQKDRQKFFSPEHVFRQQQSHIQLVREYFPPWLQAFALTTAPYAIRSPDWLRHSFV